MFNTKRKIETLQERVNELFRTIDALFDRIRVIEKKEIPNIISCSTCKCLIRKEDAVRGKSEVRKKLNPLNFAFVEEYVFTPYYCHSKDCKPKK